MTGHANNQAVAMSSAPTCARSLFGRGDVPCDEDTPAAARWVLGRELGARWVLGRDLGE